MSVKIRVVLDWAEEDVLRDLVIPSDMPLDELHVAILQSFQLSPGEMASFYYSNEDWEQGEEMPLMAFDDRQMSMKDYQVQHVLGEDGDRLLYVYDFLEMWTFFVECLSADEPEVEGAKVILIQGKRPEQAPARPDGSAEDLFGDLDLDEDFDEFDDFDDFQE